jgi:hypothetical protein
MRVERGSFNLKTPLTQRAPPASILDKHSHSYQLGTILRIQWENWRL